MKRYFRAFIYRDFDERIYYDFKAKDMDDASDRAKSSGLGDVIAVEKLPWCYSPYYVGNEPSKECGNECPHDKPGCSCKRL